jgi:hypothetical protein
MVSSLKYKVKEMKALTKAKLQAEMQAKEKYSHKYISKFLPTELNFLKPFFDSFTDHIGNIIDKDPTQLIDLLACAGLVYISTIPSESKEFKLIHACQTALAYRQLTKWNSSEIQSLAAAGWILGEIANYTIWVIGEKIKAGLLTSDKLAMAEAAKGELTKLTLDEKIESIQNFLGTLNEYMVVGGAGVGVTG